MSGTELSQFLKIVNEEEPYKHRVLFRLLAYCGMRKGELQALKWTDIDFENKTLSITKNLALIRKEYVIKKPKNGSSERLLQLDDETIQMLQKWQEIQATEFKGINYKVNYNPENFVFTCINQKSEVAPLYQDYINYLLK